MDELTRQARLNEAIMDKAHNKLSKTFWSMLMLVAGLAILTLTFVENPRWRDTGVIAGVTLFGLGIYWSGLQILKYHDQKQNLIPYFIEEEEEEEQEEQPRSTIARVGPGQMRVLPWKFRKHEWQAILDAMRKHDWRLKKDTFQDGKYFNTEHIGFSYSAPGSVDKIINEFEKMGWVERRAGGRAYMNSLGQHYVIQEAHGLPHSE